MFWLTLLATVLVLVYVYVVKPLKFWTDRNVPCLKPTPIFGNFLKVLLRKENYFEVIQKAYALASRARYAGLYKFTTPVLLVKDPGLIRTISGDDFEALPVHSRGDSSTSRDEAWRTLRAALSLPSTNTKMRSLFLLMEDHALELVHVLEKNRKTQTVEMEAFFRKYVDAVIAECIFGGGENLNSSVPFLTKLFGVNSTITEKNIRSIIKAGNKKNSSELLELLTEARRCRRLSDDAGSNSKLSEDDVLARAVLFFVSGSHAAVTLMCFLAYELATNPYIQRKLIAEVEKTLRESDGKLTYDAILGMTYLDMVVSETLRKWPPKPALERKCLKTCTIAATRPDEKPLNLPKGTSFLVPVYPLHRDPEFYYNPELFDPERFNDDNKYKRNPCIYAPFGVGRGSCVGSHLGLLETKTVVFSVLSSFEIVPVEKTRIPIVLSKRHFDVCPKDGMWLGLKPRKSKVYY